MYGYNLLANERNASGGANLHPGASCAYEHGFISWLNID